MFKSTNPEYDFETIKSENAFRNADAKGCVVVLPNPGELLIDIDSEEGANTYVRNSGKFEDHVAQIIDGKFVKSQSGGQWNYHYTIILNRDVTPLERILFQLMLGSDRTRETLSYIRLLNNDPHPTLFFEKKPKGLLGTGEELQMQCDAKLEQLHADSQDPSLKAGSKFAHEDIYYEPIDTYTSVNGELRRNYREGQ